MSLVLFTLLCIRGTHIFLLFFGIPKSVLLMILLKMHHRKIMVFVFFTYLWTLEHKNPQILEYE
jgi:hypothetical protein